MNDAAPSFPEATTVPTVPDADLWGKIERPYPTNAWWTPACLEGGGSTIHPLPYHLQLRKDQVAVCYPDYVVDKKYVCSIFVDHFRVGCKETLLGHRVLCYDDMSATFAWRTDVEDCAIKCPIVQGAPYFSVFFQNCTPFLSSLFAIAADYRGVFSGDIFRVPLNNGQIWMIYASRNITFQFNVNPCVITAKESFTGVIRIAVVPSDKEALLLLDQCRNVVPIGVQTTTNIVDEKLTYQYEFQTHRMTPGAVEGSLLMTALTHHLRLNAATALARDRVWYKSIKGPMYGIKGTVWSMTQDVVSVGWESLNPVDRDRINVIRGALYAEATMTNQHTDSYFSGKRLAAMGRLAVIADELVEERIASQIRARLKAAIEPWLESRNKDALVYDPHWGGVITTDGMRNRNADYGSGMYNDHHFQYGYYIYAAAAIGKKDAPWLLSHLQPITDLIRDFANPAATDPYFPRFRHFDFYACHSWASGLFVFQDGKNQESSSEAVHAYYAVSLLGGLIDRPDLANAAAALMHLEIVATKTYWHILSDPSPIYPSPFSSNATVGIIWNGKVDYSTWFGANLEYIHCIQMLPFLPVTELLLAPQWIERVIECIGCLKDDRSVEANWRGFVWMAIAVLDKESAWQGFVELDGAPDPGNSITNALYWIASRP